jgi:hypothetical protein
VIVVHGCEAAPAGGERAPGAHYSFYDPAQSGLGTNIAPQNLLGTKTRFPWNPRPPYAQGATSKATAQPQAVGCWQIYPTTTNLNEQWRMALGSVKSVFQNYMLIGTQWGGQLEPPTPPNPVPASAVPGMLEHHARDLHPELHRQRSEPAGSGLVHQLPQFHNAGRRQDVGQLQLPAGPSRPGRHARQDQDRAVRAVR